jgi:RNA binding activity-knot of a chromodomain
MIKQIRTLTLLASTLILGVAPQCEAQWTDSSGGSFNNPISSGLSSAIWGNLQMQQNLNMQRMLSNSTGGGGAAQGSARRKTWDQVGHVGRTGEQVDVIWRGTWYRAEILQLAGGKYKIHYTGWDSKWDEWVEPARISSIGGAAAIPSSARTTFNRTAAPVMPQQLATAMGRTPAERQQLERLFNALLKAYNEDEILVRPQQTRAEPANDVARSLAYFIVGNYYVYSYGKKPTPQQYESLHTRVRDVLLQNEQFQALNNSRRQQIHEALAILAYLPQAGYEQAEKKNDKQQIENARKLAAQNLEKLGIQADRVRQITGY